MIIAVTRRDNLFKFCTSKIITLSSNYKSNLHLKKSKILKEDSSETTCIFFAVVSFLTSFYVEFLGSFSISCIKEEELYNLVGVSN